MRKYGDDIPPEGKFLKEGWRSRDEQREHRNSYRAYTKRHMKEIMRDVLLEHKPTKRCYGHGQLYLQHIWDQEKLVEDSMFDDCRVYLSHCTNCNQSKYRYERKEEVQDCEA